MFYLSKIAINELILGVLEQFFKLRSYPLNLIQLELTKESGFLIKL